MVIKEGFALLTGIVILAGIAYAIANGDETVKIIGAGGDAFANAITAATPRKAA